MAEEKKQNEKSLEMRVAELEDRLAKLHVTEEEMRTYQKVSNLLGGQPAAPAEPLGGSSCALSPQLCMIPRAVARAVPMYPIHGCDCYLECAFCAPIRGVRWGGGFGGFGS